MFVCSICNLFGANTYAAVLRHIGLIHRYDPGLHICCGIDHCPQTYSNYESFRSHVYRKHRNELHPPSSTNETGDGAIESVADSESDPVINFDSQHEPPNTRASGAKCLLKMREEYRIPQSTLNKIIVDMKGLWALSLNSVKEKVKEAMMNPESDHASIMECLDGSFLLDGLETEYMQLSYYKQNFNYLVSHTRLNCVRRQQCVVMHSERRGHELNHTTDSEYLIQATYPKILDGLIFVYILCILCSDI